MKKKKIYISGAITGREKEAKIQFQAAEKKLKIDGCKVINPFKLNHNHDKSWNSYMRVCIAALCECDAIYLLPGYEGSRGVMMELEIAGFLDIEVYDFQLKRLV